MTSIFKILNICKLIISRPNATLGRPNETKQHYKQISESEIYTIWPINKLLYQTLHKEKQILSNHQIEKCFTGMENTFSYFVIVNVNM